MTEQTDSCLLTTQRPGASVEGTENAFMYLFISFPEYHPSLARALAVDLSCNTFYLYARTSACPSECSRSAPVRVDGVQAASVVLLASRFARSWTHLDGSPVGAGFSMLVDHALLASKRGMKPGKHGRKKVSARKAPRRVRSSGPTIRIGEERRKSCPAIIRSELGLGSPPFSLPLVYTHT